MPAANAHIVNEALHPTLFFSMTKKGKGCQQISRSLATLAASKGSARIPAKARLGNVKSMKTIAFVEDFEFTVRLKNMFFQSSYIQQSPALERGRESAYQADSRPTERNNSVIQCGKLIVFDPTHTL